MSGIFMIIWCAAVFRRQLQVARISQAQRLLREDIIDKVLKRDMTALFGVRRVLELENQFPTSACMMADCWTWALFAPASASSDQRRKTLSNFLKLRIFCITFAVRLRQGCSPRTVQDLSG